MSNSSDFNSDFAFGQKRAPDDSPNSGSSIAQGEGPNGSAKEDGFNLAVLIGLPDPASRNPDEVSYEASSRMHFWIQRQRDIKFSANGILHYPVAFADVIQELEGDVRNAIARSGAKQLDTLLLCVAGYGRFSDRPVDAELLFRAQKQRSIPLALNLSALLHRIDSNLLFKQVLVVFDVAEVPPEIGGLGVPTSGIEAVLRRYAEPCAIIGGYNWSRGGDPLVPGEFVTAFIQAVSGPDGGEIPIEELKALLTRQRIVGGYSADHAKLVVVRVDPENRPSSTSRGILGGVDGRSAASNFEGDDASPLPNRTVPAQLDIAATVDQLNRRPFAQILAKRIREVNARRDQPTTPASERDGAYIIHLHGQWGTGKSTVLNFLREELRPKDDPSGWVVVDFNAWRTQSSRPPWWTLVREVHRQARTQVPFKYKRGIWWQWVVWHWAMAMGPWILAAAVMMGVAYLLKGLGTATELIAGVIAGAITLVTLGRSLLFGSSKAAESFMDHRKDVTRPVKDRYAKLIRAIGQPVIVFVDDVDRCDKAYVVELLEGIQTLFRDAPVTFLIAADRKWICRSFEKHFEDFNSSVGDAARPLGYLFLEKLFQLSVSLPPLSLGLQQQFQAELLRQGGDPAKAEQVLQEAEALAEQKLKPGLTQAEADHLVDATTNFIEKQALQRVLAMRLASVELDKSRKHDLEPFAKLIEANPRAIKRFLNAYGIQQSLSRLENRRIPSEHLVRWTILELRWPLFAEHVCVSPKVIDHVKLASVLRKRELDGESATAKRQREEDEEQRGIDLADTPQFLKELLDDPHLVSVVGVSHNGGRVLTSQVVLNIVGTLVEPTQDPEAASSDVMQSPQPKSA